MIIGGEHFMGQVIIRVDTTNQSLGYIPHDSPVLPVGPTLSRHYTILDIEGQVPHGSDESIEELALEEALAVAMAKRQGDE